MSIAHQVSPNGIAARAFAAGTSVYFLMNHDNGLVKIGYSSVPSKRLTALRSAIGGAVELIRLVDGGRPVERWLHKRFAPFRIRGEWFRYHDDMLVVAPPDEIVAPEKVVLRRDVKLTVKEKLRNAERLGADIRLSATHILSILATDLDDDEARSILDYIAARASS